MEELIFLQVIGQKLINVKLLIELEKTKKDLSIAMEKINQFEKIKENLEEIEELKLSRTSGITTK